MYLNNSPNKLVASSPFPLPVMKSLAEQLFANSFGYTSPDLLSDDFIYSSPFDGPMNKKEFLKYGAGLTSYLSDIDFNFFNVHIDPFQLGLFSTLTQFN
jgi:hypothetical protein